MDRVDEIIAFEDVKNEIKGTIELDSYKGKMDQLQKDNKIEKFENNIKELKKYGRDDIMVVVGGVIPKQDYQYLFDSS